MARTHNLGFPRIGARRELKAALEAHWSGRDGRALLLARASELRAQSWQRQRGLDLVPVGDFSLYDHVLDHSAMLGNLPERVAALPGDALDRYFRAARGRAPRDLGPGVAAGELTKWFDSNYHYIVPELHAGSAFALDAAELLAQLAQARALGVAAKPVVLGPLSYLRLGKSRDGCDPLALLPRLLPVYTELLAQLSAHGAEWVQLDEPILVTELAPDWQAAFRHAYGTLAAGPAKLLLATYFGKLLDNLPLACSLPVAGLHLDAVRARSEVERVLSLLPRERLLSLGVVDGRNVWKTDLAGVLDWLEPIQQQLGDRLWLAPSCSLLHVPVDLDSETKLDPELRSWLAFAVQKLAEVQLLARALNEGRAAVAAELEANRGALASRRRSPRVHDPAVAAALTRAGATAVRRHSPYAARAQLQRARLHLPRFPTTTIGSFPQTAQIRAARRRHKQGELDDAGYREAMRAEIAYAIREQEALGLDVLVHGEAERNDMVEYFGGQLAGYALSEYGWVQSYGSRCVKPPLLFGDVSRPAAMTVEWIQYAQSLTARPVKGMLTGPVTMLNWSFVRDDQPRALTCRQLALALRDEVLDLERAGVRVIQIDEAALREGLPLRRSQWAEYLSWAVGAFCVTANGVADQTQIHTHMCYSEFNDILPSIAEMDADVITIETSRSDMKLLAGFEHFRYPNEIGPGVYDIHSPNIPSEAEIADLLRKASERVPPERLWVNPDCGLKTRSWEEVRPALRSMVSAASSLRAQG